MCNKHYNRWYRSSRTDHCMIEGCDRPTYARGWCNAHYGRWLKYGDPKAFHATIYGSAVCSMAGCDKPAVKRGWCGMHYKRWRLHGDPTVTIRQWTKQQGECCVDGCSRIAEKRGWCGTHYSRWLKQGDPTFVLSGRRCGICSHPQREQIEGQWLAGVPAKELARRFGIDAGSPPLHMDLDHIVKDLTQSVYRITQLKQVDNGTGSDYGSH